MSEIDVVEAQPDNPEAKPTTPVGFQRSCLEVWLVLAFVGLIAAGFRFWNLDQNGFGNPYYGAAARSMSMNGSNFFFNSFDPAGFVTLDKPPVALWIQAISVRLFGFNTWSVLAPQAIMGVLSCLLLCQLVGHRFGSIGGLIAGLGLAVSPVNVAVDRLNLPDSALVFFSLLAAGAFLKSMETKSIRWWLVSLALIGVCFNTKMLAGFIVLPAFYGLYFLFGPVSFWKRSLRLITGSVILVLVAGSWTAIVDLTPTEKRPYIGGSKDNTVLDLVIGYNGLGRIFGNRNRFGEAPEQESANSIDSNAKKAGKEPSKEDDNDPGVGAAPFQMPGGFGGFGGFGAGGPGRGRGPGGGGPGAGPMRRGMPGFGGTPGWDRLANQELSGQGMWLFPLAILGCLASLVYQRGFSQRISVLLWSGWFLIHAVVFSTSKGTFHPYYLSMLSPALAAMAGISVGSIWTGFRDRNFRGWILLLALVANGFGQWYILKNYPEWEKWMLPIIFGSLGLVALRQLQVWRWGRPGGSELWSRIFLSVAIAGALVAPTAWTLTLVLGRPSTVLPAADPALLKSPEVDPDSPGAPPGGGRRGPGMMGGMMGGMMPGGRGSTNVSPELISFLQKNRHDERILVATPNSMAAAPIIIKTGETAIAAGGFMGGDPAMTKERIQQMVENGEVRFVMIMGGMMGGRPGGMGGGRMGGRAGGMGRPPGGFGGMGGPPGGPGGMMANREWMDWVKKNGKLVPSKLWQSTSNASPMGAMMQLYDCKPELGLVTVGTD